MEEADRHVAYDEINDMQVSTVFLGVNYSVDECGAMLFETMIFGDETNEMHEYCRKHSTWDDAEAGHKEVVDMARRSVLRQELIKGL